MTITYITPFFSVSGELSEAEVTQLVHEGVSTLINVRPDNEAPGQKSDQYWCNLCAKYNLKYVFIPVKPGQYSEQDIATFKAALLNDTNKIHAFCRTGTRACHLFALANKHTFSYDDIHSLLKSKGYDASIIATQLTTGV